MRFMIVVKATKDSEAGVKPSEELFAAMATITRSWRRPACCSTPTGCSRARRAGASNTPDGKRTVIDGPFTEAKELIAGYTMIQVKSREEAIEWSRRFPNPHPRWRDCEIEVRQLFELEDFGESEALDRFREMGLAAQKSPDTD